MTDSEMLARYNEYLSWMPSQALALAGGEQPPAWRKTLGQSEVDDVVAMSDGRVLVCIGQTREHKRLLLYGPCVMLDAQTGNEIWRHPRPTDYRNVYDVIGREPVVLRRVAPGGATTVTALDTETGVLLWTRTWPHPPVMARDVATGNHMLLEEVRGGASVLHMLDPATGTSTFETTVPVRATAKGTRPRLMPMIDRVFVIGDSVAAVSLPEGSIAWHATPGAIAPASVVLELPGGSVVVPTEDARVVHLDNAGKQRWTIGIDRPARVLARAGELIIAEHRQAAGEQGTSLVALDVDSGDIAWAYAIRSPLSSPIVVADDRIAFMRGDGDLEIVDLDGNRIAATYLRVMGGYAPSRLKVYAQHVVLVKGRCAAAFSLVDGALLWYFGDKCGWRKQPSSYAYARYAVRDAAKDANRDVSGILEVYDERVGALHAIVAETNARQLVQQRVGAAGRVGGSRGRSPGTGAGRRSSTFSRWAQELDAERAKLELRVAEGRGGTRKLELNKTWRRHVASAALMESSSNFLEAANRAAREIYKSRVDLGIFEGRLKTLPFRVQIALRTDARTMSGDHLALVFRQTDSSTLIGRYALLIVDMRSGRWAEVSLGPDPIYQRVLRVNEVFPTIDLDGRRVYVRGLGLDPSVWRRDRFPSGRKIFLPAPGLLSYELEDLQFKDAAAYPGSFKVFSGRRGEMIPISAGTTTVADLEQAIGPATKRTPTEIQWYSLLAQRGRAVAEQWGTGHKYGCDSTEYFGEIVTCKTTGATVRGCETSRRKLGDIPFRERDPLDIKPNWSD